MPLLTRYNVPRMSGTWHSIFKNAKKWLRVVYFEYSLFILNDDFESTFKIDIAKLIFHTFCPLGYDQINLPDEISIYHYAYYK